MKGKIGGIYNALQELELRPTPENARIMTAVYNTLVDLYEQLEKEERKDDGQTSDPEPRPK